MTSTPTSEEMRRRAKKRSAPLRDSVSGRIDIDKMKTARGTKDVTAVRSSKSNRGCHGLDFPGLVAAATSAERIALEVDGVPSRAAFRLFRSMRLDRSDIVRLLGRSNSTVRRYEQTPGAIINDVAGHAIIGVADLVATVREIVAAAGDPVEARGFDAEAWLGSWLCLRHPALGGRAPLEYMRSPTWRAAVRRVLGAMHSGAYQ